MGAPGRELTPLLCAGRLHVPTMGESLVSTSLWLFQRAQYANASCSSPLRPGEYQLHRKSSRDHGLVQKKEIQTVFPQLEPIGKVLLYDMQMS